MTRTQSTDPGRPGRLSAAAQFGLIAGPFLSMIDSNVVNVALPVMLKDFQATLTSVQWVLSAYLLASGGALVCSPYLSKNYGPQRVYRFSLLGFTCASALCALSPDLAFLVAARVLQGALGAVMVPLAMDMLLGKEAASRRISPAFGVMLFLAPALGPTVGGFLIGLAGWPSIFLINVPLGVASAIAISRVSMFSPVPLSQGDTGFDFVGAVTLAGGAMLGLYGATEGPAVGWMSSGSLPFWGAGVVLLVIYSFWDARRPNPAVNLKLLKSVQTALALVIATVAATVLFAILFLLPIFTETVQGLSATTTGLILLPQGVVTGVGTWVGDKLSSERSDGRVRLTTILGMGILTGTTGMLLLVQAGTPAWVTACMLSLRGLALGLTIQPLLYVTVGRLEGRDVPDGNTLFNVMDRLGGSVGVSLLATFFQADVADLANRGLGTVASTLSGFHDTVLVLTAVSAVGVLLAVALTGGPNLEQSSVSASRAGESRIV